jgi:choline kinase
MDVVILAAGRGSRLGALGEACPKWLLEVHGTTLAERQLEAIAEADRRVPGAIRSVRVVAGHAASAVRRFLEERKEEVAVVENPSYHGLNNWFSLLLALRSLRSEPPGRVAVLNSDLFASSGWLARFLAESAAAEHDAVIGVDVARPLTNESMKVGVEGTSNGQLVLERIGKVGVEPAVGEYVGMFAVEGEALGALRDALEGFVGDPAAAGRWYEDAIGATAKMGVRWVLWPTTDSRWVEIDDDADYREAIALEER